MTDRNGAPEQLPAPETRILLYSDDRNVREAVLLAVGFEVGGREIRWTETATHAAVVSEVDAGGYDLLILDGEAAKVGGMGICRQLKDEVKDCPPVLIIVGRADDAWLATWSKAEAAISHPIDPFEMKAAVEGFFTPAAAQHD